MNIKIKSEQELIDTCRQAIYILSNLRKFTSLWEESHGVELKLKKKRWESNADKFIELLNARELKTNEYIKIEINGTERDTTPAS